MSYFQFILVSYFGNIGAQKTDNHDVGSDGLNQIVCTYICFKHWSFFYFYGNPKGMFVNSRKRPKN